MKLISFAREESFKSFLQQVGAVVLAHKINNVDDIADKSLVDSNKTVEEMRLELVSQLGENITIRRVSFYEVADGSVIGSYLHGGQDGARIGALVICNNTTNIELARDIAMQVAAMSPEYLNESAIPAERVEKEQGIFLAEVKQANADKPDAILEKIVAGKIKKFVKEITLVNQVFVKDSSQTIAALLNSNKAEISEYIRFEVGEGLEKKEDDFVSEVMSQVKG